MLLPLIFEAPHGAAAISETGTRIFPFVPFWGSRSFIARMSARTRRFVTLDAYTERIMTSTRVVLDGQLDMRQMPRIEGETDDRLRLRLLAFLADVELPDDPLSVMGIGELRAIAASRGLNSQALPDDLRALLSVSAPYAAAGQPINEAAPIPAASNAAQAVHLDAAVVKRAAGDLDRLRKALAEDDYRDTWAALCDLTEDRPETRSKPDVMEFARELLASLT